MAKKIIVISAGHYKYTSGKRCMKSIDPNETREWTLNARIADKVQAGLEKYEEVEVYRLDDPTGEVGISIEDRAKRSDQLGATFYLAIHHNAGINGGKGGGVVVYHFPLERNKDQAKRMYNLLIAHAGLKGNRSNPIVATRELYEVYKPKADSLLIENGFMDSQTDTPIILTEDFAQKSADAMVEFFVTYFGLKAKDGTPPVKTQTATPTAPTQTTEAPKIYTFTKGQSVKLKDGATYYNGKTIPNWVKKSKLYYRGESKNGYIFSILKVGAITGTVKKEDLLPV